MLFQLVFFNLAQGIHLLHVHGMFFSTTIIYFYLVILFSRFYLSLKAVDLGLCVCVCVCVCVYQGEITGLAKLLLIERFT